VGCDSDGGVNEGVPSARVLDDPATAVCGRSVLKLSSTFDPLSAASRAVDIASSNVSVALVTDR